MSPTRVTHPQDDGRGEHFRVRIEGFGVGTWDLDLKTMEWEWSDASKALLGVPADQPESYELFLARLEPKDRERVESAIRRVSERGGGLDVSFRVAGAIGG
ncbi:PAS domain-containing protein, partial [Bradyrhizobium manausense]|uniref:PAS domain-containing protein n=1 Tax=Bradyrhizobium manausense TaxID=989370 RepID=UPI003221DC16